LALDSITTTGHFATDNAASLSVRGREVVSWQKNGVAQRLAAGGMIVGAVDRHGLPVLVEASAPAGCAPIQVTVGYGDTLTVL
jgi:hypothetical protein